MNKLIVEMIAVVAFATGAQAADAQRSTLKGLPGVVVAVTIGSLDSKLSASLTPVLQVKSALRLRQNRITVLEKTGPGRPVLQVMITLCTAPQGVAFFVTAVVNEAVKLTRTGQDVRSGTYSAYQTIGLTNSVGLKTALEDAVMDALDHFINDFLAENPLQ